MFVGIKPGSDEMETRRPLTGPNGRLLDAMLEAVNLRREDMYATNLLCAQDMAVTVDNVKACHQRYLDELSLVQPKLIIPLGAEACELLTGYKVGKARGIPLHRGGGYVMATNHPVAIYHNPGAVYDIIRDLAKIPDILGWPSDGSIKDVRFSVATSTEEAQAMLNARPVGDLVAVDIETTSSNAEYKDVYTDRILCIAFTYANIGGDYTFVVPHQFLSGLVWRQDLQYIFHGGIFDVVGIKREFDVMLRIARDTLLESYCIDERSGKDNQVRIHGLGAVGGEYCGGEFWKDEVNRKRMGEEYAASPSKVHAYNARDAAYTFRAQKKRYDILQHDGMAPLYNNILIPAVNAFTEITYTGVRVDAAKFAELKQDWGVRYIKSERALMRNAQELGFSGNNLNSPQQMAKFLFGVLGLPVQGKTATGRDSVKEEYIEELDHPFIERYLRHKKLGKSIETYIFGVEDDIKADGCIHPEPLLHGTSTGRLSYHNPPIQTIPKHFDNIEDRELIRVRELFVPHNVQTHTFVAVDYSQLEIWIAQWLSGDPVLLEDLLSGDYHGRVCENVLGYKKAEIDKDTWDYHRTRAKRVTFGVFYGIGADGLSKRKTGIGCDRETASNYIRYYFNRYPDYARFYREQIRLARDVGEITTIFGRKRRFPLVLDNRADRQAVNFPVQSTASDVCLTALIELHDLLKPYDSRVVWSVHDELLFEVSRQHYDKVVPLITHTMSKPRLEGMPTLPVEATTGDNLHHMQKVA